MFPDYSALAFAHQLWTVTRSHWVGDSLSIYITTAMYRCHQAQD